MLYRKEIDGLRAICILPVIFYHFNFPYFNGGYIGVDIFFVISGYLICSLVIKDINEKRFSLKNFYERRARRLLPALFFLMIICIPFAWFLLIPSEFKSFGRSLISTSFFFSNILFWQESGYFSSPSELKPLIHTWSLAVEEQYYLFFPLLFFLFNKSSRRYLVYFLIIFFFISLFTSNWAAYNKPSANFYLLPTRIWEILTGAILAFFISSKFRLSENKFLSNSLGLIGFFLISFSIIFFDDTTPFPSFFTLIPVLGTILIIYFSENDSLIFRLLSNKFLVFIGLISYSFYLWHQPFLAFGRHFYGNNLSSLNVSTLLISSFIFSILSYFYIEKPFRKNNNKFSRSQIFRLSFLFIFTLSSIGFIIDQTNGFRNFYLSNLDPEFKKRFEEYEINTSRDFFKDIRNRECNFWSKEVDENFKNKFEQCNQKYGEATFVVGDSHAINLFNILYETKKIKFLVGISDGGCRIHQEWICFYDDLLDFINLNTNAIKKVIYHQSGIYLIKDRFGNLNSVEAFKEIGPPRISHGSILKIVNYLEKISKNNLIFWLGPHPENIEDLSSKIIKNQKPVIERNSILKNNILNIELDKNLKENNLINFIPFKEFYEIDMDFFIEENCLTFRDRDHFSICGEILISKNLKIDKFE